MAADDASFWPDAAQVDVIALVAGAAAVGQCPDVAGSLGSLRRTTASQEPTAAPDTSSLLCCVAGRCSVVGPIRLHSVTRCSPQKETPARLPLLPWESPEAVWVPIPVDAVTQMLPVPPLFRGCPLRLNCAKAVRRNADPWICFQMRNTAPEARFR